MPYFAPAHPVRSTGFWHRYRYGFVAIATALVLLFFNLGFNAGIGASPQVQPPPQTLYPPFLDPYVNDYGQVLEANDKATMRAALAKFTAETEIQVVVLAIDSIFDYRTGDNSIESFATHLFNTWGIGDRIRNDGILILVAPGDRKVRIELGEGYDAEDEQTARDIIDDTMLPYFREGRISQGTVAGVNAVVARFNPNSLSDTGTGSGYDGAGGGDLWRQLFLFEIPLLWSRLPSVVQVIIGGLVAFFVSIPLLRVRKRYGTHRCPKCKSNMVRLNEEADNQYLDAGKQKEEQLGSVNYDVWLCRSCSHHILKPYQNLSSQYQKCPMCYRKTLELSTHTLRYATYEEEGEEKVTESCENCSHRREYHRSISQLTPVENTDNTSSNGGRSEGEGATGSW
ncbi:MAG: TPM domain-containing protein [Synechococcales bacterium]|nr:TPM domain-containing protein [Synechococcales bacterium]